MTAGRRPDFKIGKLRGIEADEFPADPFCNSSKRPIDVHLSNQLLSGDVTYGSMPAASTATTMSLGHASQDEALSMVQSVIEKAHVKDAEGVQSFAMALLPK